MPPTTRRPTVSSSTKTGLEKLAYILVVIWLGFQILNEIVQFIPTWISEAYGLAVKISGQSPPPQSSYLAVLLSPLLIIPVIGWLASEIKRLGERAAKPPAVLPEPPISPPIKTQIAEAIRSAGKELADGISNEIARKPWWVITIFATLLGIGAVSLAMPLPVAFAIGILLLLAVPISFVNFAISLAKEDETSWERNGLFVISTLILFAGFVTFQIDSINEILGRWHLFITQWQIQPPALLPQPIKGFLVANNPMDYVRIIIIICASIGGLLQMSTSESRIRGLVSGALFGSIIGLGLGALVSFGWTFGSLFSNILKP